MNILLLDVETSPNIAHAWSLFKTTISVNQIVTPSKLLCWSAKWYGKKGVFFRDWRDKDMLKAIWALMNEADAICHYNGLKFDIPVLNREFITHGFLPPAPSKQIDLCHVVQSRFMFASSKLAHVSKELGLSGKVEHSGHDLWVGCMAGDKKAWALMKKYNIRDTVLLEGMYEKLRPWVTPHPAATLYDEASGECPSCGKGPVQKRGVARTNLRKYQRYQCQNCGSWIRGNRMLEGTSLQVMAAQ